MLSGKLLQLIESHSEQIAGRMLELIRKDPELETLASLPDTDLFETWNRIVSRLEKWLDPSQREELALDQQESAKVRFRQRIPLHEGVYALHLLRNEVIKFARSQSAIDNYLELYVEEELEHWLANFFDFLVFNSVKGYEEAYRDVMPAA